MVTLWDFAQKKLLKTSILLANKQMHIALAPIIKLSLPSLKVLFRGKLCPFRYKTKSSKKTTNRKSSNRIK